VLLAGVPPLSNPSTPTSAVDLLCDLSGLDIGKKSYPWTWFLFHVSFELGIFTVRNLSMAKIVKFPFYTELCICNLEVADFAYIYLTRRFL
jgi:hypothetical protein